MNTQLPAPTATYRLQFNHEFTFRNAAAIVPYLATLGISHCYASPYLRSRPGSMHGYDIIDHNALNPEIGSAEDYEHFVDELHRHGMGQILDIVPNHMAVMGSDNAWWLDVLENGEASEYAGFFDIDWHPVKSELQGKVLVPILGNQYGNELESGKLRLCWNQESGEFNIFYNGHRFPIDPREYPRILLLQLDRLQADLGTTHEDVLELQSIATALSHLPRGSELSDQEKAERAGEKEVQKRRLSTLVIKSSQVQQAIESSVQQLNGTPANPESFEDLHELTKAQSYRLAYWRVASDDINYRRFFDINDLAALRMENDAVFDATHKLVLNLVALGKVNGLRIDHPDGLFDPKKYLHRVRELVDINAPAQSAEGSKPYLVVEKILTGSEPLRKDWPVQGTTGYEFANLVGRLFVDQSGLSKMERAYRSFIAYAIDFDELVYSCKKVIIEGPLASELGVLSNALSGIALSNRHTCDFTLNSLRNALSEIIASFPVYRTYVDDSRISDLDREYIQQAVGAARRRSREGDLSIFDFVRLVLLTELPAEQWTLRKQAITRFAMKFQQVTSAVMARGLEDTAFYRYNRLVSLNEVGGNPSKFGVKLEEFHAANQQRLNDWPDSMLATSTHDSKRSEDVRARISALSELPALWRLNVGRWKNLNRGKKRLVDGKLSPSRNDEYLLYQTLVGAWPLGTPGDSQWSEFIARIEAYSTKAVREAKEFTSWANPSTQYEEAVMNFVRAILRRGTKNKFLPSMEEFHRSISRIGMLNSLSQLLLKLTSPGVPDIYQGNELWDFSLVDPDNRRPVDYAARERILHELQQGETSTPDESLQLCQELARQSEDGRIKFYVTWKTLCFRRSHHALFREGAYIPLAVKGERANHVCAFARSLRTEVTVVLAPRLWGGLLSDGIFDPAEDIWRNTCVELPSISENYCNLFTGQTLQAKFCELLSAALGPLPVALLVGVS